MLLKFDLNLLHNDLNCLKSNWINFSGAVFENIIGNDTIIVQNNYSKIRKFDKNIAKIMPQEKLLTPIT